MNLSPWEQQYETESNRLVDALGNVTEGGIVDAIQHIGATSVSGLAGSSCIDIGIAVWPFPLEAGPRSRIEAMGYQVVEGYTESPQQRFRHASNSFQLFFVEPGTGDWANMILIRDYLLHNDEICREVSARKADPNLDKAALFNGLVPGAQQWWVQHYGFSPLEEIANEFHDAPFEWYVSGGWALDLFLGTTQRVHLDVDVIVPRSAQMELQKHLLDRKWKLMTPFEKRLEPWPTHMVMNLPRHQIHAHRGEQFIDILLTDMQDVWRYRREPSILRSKERMSLVSSGGIPYLAPELVLLFKSKNTSNHERAKDQTDFDRALPHLEPERRAWLHWALTAASQDHAWIKQLI